VFALKSEATLLASTIEGREDNHAGASFEPADLTTAAAV
jgi:hypothetical protein